MCFKILFLISFVSIGSSAPPVHSNNKSNQATYSQSFVREDVPLSYQYSAVHNYTPKKHIELEHSNLKKNNYYPELGTISQKNIQYVPVPQNSREYSHPVTPTRSPSPVLDYTQYKVPKISDGSEVAKYNLEPKQVPNEAKHIKPSTYKPHLNSNVRIYNSSTFLLDPHYYREMRTQMTKDDALHQLGIFQQEQYPYAASGTTESIKYTNIPHPTISFLRGQRNPLSTVPHENNRYSSLQPIPSTAYLNKNYVITNGPHEKSSNIQMYHHPSLWSTTFEPK